MKKTLVCLTAHQEGDLLRDAYESVRAASLPIAFLQGLRVIVLEDNPNEKTRSVAKSLGCEVIEVDHKDVGPARNWVMETFAAEFDFIVFLDGDDMWSGDFLANAIFRASSASSRVIVSPNYRVQFWGKGRVRSLPFWQPSVPEKYRERVLEINRATNLWGSTFLISSEAAKSLRFRAEKDGYGFEDWWFSVDSLEAGVERVTAKGIHFYRQRFGSRRRKQAAMRIAAPGRTNPKPLKNPGAKFGKNRSYWGLAILLLQFRPWVRAKLPVRR
jgi:glycosyltransferase involved in cell wall biosynthesis